MTEQSKGVLITTLGVLAIVPDSLLIRLIDAGVLTIAFWRACLASSVILIGLTLVYRARTPAILRGLGRAGLVYAVFMGLGTLLFVSAVQLTTVASALFIVSTSPVFAALVTRAVLGDRITPRMAWTIAFSLAGVGVIASGELNASGPAFWGNLCALGTAISLAFAFTAARSARHISMVPAAGVAYLLTTVALLPFAAPETMQGMDWIWAAFLGCVFVPIGTSLMALGPRYIQPAEVSLLLLLEAILAPLLIWAVLGEFPGLRTLVGGAMVLGVLLISNLIALKRARRVPMPPHP
ncbi:EamA family transporter [Maritimibacter sp. 55A14]|uniref:DMT family transporter n=1 Tax=Maritimibacter sp. 55A14 TaxID=2174844 RepID=UPI000D61F4F7|nr:DMT family transporter [Maritimibacter sp. 55A14]PWE33838.1 EamA family transporter [Maritimibacter sp. 55A14]